MTRGELLDRLRSLAGDEVPDVEAVHADADRALVEYVDDPEITEAYHAVPKWYA